MEVVLTILAMLEGVLIVLGPKINGHTKSDLKGRTLGTTTYANNIKLMAYVLGLSLAVGREQVRPSNKSLFISLTT